MNYRIHLLHYALLLAIITLGLFGFWYFSFNRILRFVIVSLSVFGYVGWGVWHHYIEKRLSWSIVLEYLLLSLIVLSALSLTFRF